MNDPAQLEWLLRSVTLTRDEEIDCSTCLDLVPIYVDLEIVGQNAPAQMPELHQHLLLCRDCFEEYEALRDVMQLDEDDGLPERATLLEELESRHEPT